MRAVVLACRSTQRGAALKAELEAAAKAAGQAKPQLEVRVGGGGLGGLGELQRGPAGRAPPAAPLEAKNTRLAPSCFSLESELSPQLPPPVQVARLDLSSLASVRDFAAAWGRRPLHALVNNAGVFALAGPRAETEDGFEMHLGTNHLGHFLLTLLLLPSLRDTAAQVRAGGPGLRPADGGDLLSV